MIAISVLCKHLEVSLIPINLYIQISCIITIIINVVHDMLVHINESSVFVRYVRSVKVEEIRQIVCISPR